MPPTFPAHGVLLGARTSPGEIVGQPASKAAVAQPFVQDTGPPPAAASRAEQIFEYTGMALILVIVVSALMILIRGRR